MEQVLSHGFDVASFLSPPAAPKPRLRYQLLPDHTPERGGSGWCALRSTNTASRRASHACVSGVDAAVAFPARVQAGEMAQTAWRSPAGSKGEKVCDSRYRSIISTIDSLLDMLQRQPDRDLAAELDRLMYAMSEHFSTEESAMMLVRYPNTLFHTERHHAISFTTAKLRYRSCIGDRVTVDELGSIRLLWLEHIEDHDAPFARFLAPKVPPLNDSAQGTGSPSGKEEGAL